MEAVRVLLISTYELGRQPFGLASPAAWLSGAGHDVTLADLSRSSLPRGAAEQAELIAFFLPMHTATRLFLKAVERVRALNPSAHLCAYGLYAPLNERLLREAGVRTIIGGEFEQALANVAGQVFELGCSASTEISLERQQFRVPDRTGLPPLASYARLAVNGSTRTVGYTEASRGCKHLCRHCPVVPVYGGVFRIVQPEIVLEDIRRQVACGAEHITFGDPDFLNGPGHAVKIVEALHHEWPRLTYDATIKIEHLLKHRDLLGVLKTTGCVFVTSAVESLDDAVLEKLAKGHTRGDFLEALDLTRAAEVPLSPTFIPFTPWTTLDSYRRFVRDLARLDLCEQVAPIQLAIRLLLPEGSLLLELPEIRGLAEPFDAHALCYPWRHPDPMVDTLWASIQELIKRDERRHSTRTETFRKIAELALGGPLGGEEPRPARATIPYLTEPWYC
ncbi:MAG TPA: CUAEP/CCAEP-tail radical SAM protein [Bryobacteraceae bacterium]|nr:CUAEP/CCAEP-tail radical SAM protein [Bryobacteraceae bacterium]